MYGHGAAPPTRSAATVITLRVLFAAAGFLSCGVLSCVPLFRVAILRGRWFDWMLAWVSLPVSIACFAVVGTVPESDSRGDIALAVVLLLGAAASAYFLVMDIRFHSGQGRFTGFTPPQAPAAHPGYGYPQPASPYAGTPVPQSPQSPQPPQPSASHTPIPRAPAAPPQPPQAPPGPVPPPPSPHRPAPARIDQVRAELDELSDYLRRHEGREDRHDGNHEGGR